MITWKSDCTSLTKIGPEDFTSLTMVDLEVRLHFTYRGNLEVRLHFIYQDRSGRLHFTYRGNLEVRLNFTYQDRSIRKSGYTPLTSRPGNRTADSRERTRTEHLALVSRNYTRNPLVQVNIYNLRCSLIHV